MNGMETYHGHVRTPTDAIILFEACRIGLLPRVQRRLSEKERQSIKSGSVFVWDEREAGMRRWTDGKSWSASRVSGSFLTYREMEGKRGSNGFDKSQQNRDGMQNAEPDEDGGGPDGYRYKPDGLMKQSFSITTNGGQHLHLISYFSRSSQAASGLVQPSNDPQLRHIRPEKGMYPESTVHEQSNIPAVTRGPMGSPGYTHSPNHAPYGRPPYGYPPHPGWAPPSPLHTPPPHAGYAPYYGAPHTGYPGQSPMGMHYPPPHGYPHPGMTPYDRPPPMGNTGVPPGYGPYMAPHGYNAYHGHQGGYSGYQPPPLSQPNYPPQPQQPTAYDNRQQQQQQSQSQPPAASLPQPQSQESNSNGAKDDRQDSHQSNSTDNTATAVDPAPKPSSSSSSDTTAQADSGAQQATSGGQTIPSISAMLNAGKDGQPPPRNSSRSPSNNGARPLQDIPTHKLGFEVSRDVQALRSLDGYSTLKK